MRTRLIFFMALLGWTTSFAQIFEFGMRGGVNATDVRVNEIFTLNFDSIVSYASEGNRGGFHIGAYTRFKLLGLQLQPELLLTRINGAFDYQEIIQWQTTTLVQEYTATRIDVPILAGMQLGPVRGLLGPVASLTLSSTMPNVDRENWYYGFQAGVGLDLWRLTMDLRYEGSLMNVTKGVNIYGRQFDFDARVSQVIFAVGYRILPGSKKSKK
jgi:hypothetical protein